MSSFTQKRLRVTLILSGANSVFPGTNSNTLVLEDLRMSARVQSVARLATQADIRIFGMKAADMDALTVAWANPPIVLDHLVVVEADSGSGYSQVFRGTITEAQPNYGGAPDVSFGITAMTGYLQKITPTDGRSFPASADIDTIVGGIVADMGGDWNYENGGAFGTLAEGAYFWGSLWDQLAQACESTNTDFYVFGNTVLITEFGKPRTAQPSVTLSRFSGLIGYPSYERAGLMVSAIFNPAFLCGTPVDVESDVPSATGRWYPYALTHMLDALTPGGQWITQMMCNRVLG